MMKNTSQGFTLIELFIVIAIAGILFTTAVSSFSSLVKRSNVSSQINQMVGLINLARETAVAKNTITTICPAAVTESQCGRNWSSGVMLFKDNNLNHQLDPNERIIKRLEALPNGHKLTWRAFQNKNYLQFSPSGFTRYQNGTFRYCISGDDLSFNRALIINMAGRLRQSQDSNEDGIFEDSNKKPVICT
jgi:type IV fimbrial biogenesis protein FimT